mgnify:FL=1
MDFAARLARALAAALLIAVGSGLAHAQTRAEPPEPVTIAVFGDSLADGLWTGLYRAFRNDPRVAEIEQLSEVSTGLSNWRYVHVGEATREQLQTRDVAVAVVMFGANDIQGLVHQGRVHPFRTEGWERVYRARVREVVRVLQDHGARVYWVGLPRMRSDRYDANTVFLNRLYRAEAEALGAVFIPTRAVTSGPDGEYSAYLPDASGRARLMRADDGVHFTLRGYQRLAAPVAAVMEADLDEAMQQRERRRRVAAFLRSTPVFDGARRLDEAVIAARFDEADWLCRPAEPGEIEALDPFADRRRRGPARRSGGP